MPVAAPSGAARERARATRPLPRRCERQERPPRGEAPSPAAARWPSIEELTASWRVAFDAAESALHAARESLPAAEVSRRRRLLVEERAVTLHLLEAVARERASPAGLDVLDRLVDSGEWTHLAKHAGLSSCVQLEDLAQVRPGPDDRTDDRDSVQHGLEDRERQRRRVERIDPVGDLYDGGKGCGIGDEPGVPT
jgi:hypothetical protein